MPRFTVLCRVDAYVDYEAVVEAETAEDAAELANYCPEDYKWQELGPVEFDARGYVTLDDDRDEIESTRQGCFG